MVGGQKIVLFRGLNATNPTPIKKGGGLLNSTNYTPIKNGPRWPVVVYNFDTPKKRTAGGR